MKKVVTYFLITSFDGVIRIVGYILGLQILFFYKEVLFVSLLISRKSFSLVKNHPLTLPFLFFLFTAIISALVNADNFESYLIPLFGIKVGFFFMPIIFLVRFNDITEVEKFLFLLLKVINSLMIPLLFLAAIQFAFGSALYTLLEIPQYGIVDLRPLSAGDSIFRPISTFRGAHEFGLFFLLSFALNLYQPIIKNRKLFIALALLGVVFSTAKGAIFCSIVLMGLYFSEKKNIRIIKMLKKNMILFIIFFFTIVFGSIYFFYSNVDFTDNIALSEIGSRGVDIISTGAARIVGWVRIFMALDIFTVTNIFFGRGFGLYGAGTNVLANMNNYDYDILLATNSFVADNNYLYLFMNSGLLSIFAVYLILKKVNQFINLNTFYFGATWVYSFVSNYTAIMLVYSLFFNLMEAFPAALYLYIALGLPFHTQAIQKSKYSYE